MAVTELALLRLQSNAAADDPSVRMRLGAAKKALEEFTQRTYHFFSQTEDPKYIYVIVEWMSVQQHIDASPTLQRLLEDFKDLISVEWMFHVDVEEKCLPLDAPIISIARYFVSGAQKGAFAEQLSNVEHFLRESVAPNPEKHGWRIDKEDPDKEECVLFTGWDDVESHHAFAKTEAFKEFSKIKEHMTGAEIKHAARLEL
ncbi:MAG: hypothetical protein LQ351_006611 [Letrouitia transgressa]|nr:MAG: hypothetical protein LQ351_006611 [Letrouitia transgressa]